MRNKREKISNEKILYISVIVLLAFRAAFVASLRCYDSDTSFIIATGRYIVEQGIPYTNPFTIIEGLKIIVQQWLWDVWVFFVYDALGKAGLYMTVFVSMAVITGLIYRLSLLLGLKRAAAFFMGILFVGMNVMFISIRPTSVTLILLLWQLCILERYKKDGKKGRLLLLIVISVLEANFHSALWVMHFIFLLPYIVPPIKNPLVSFEEYDVRTRLPVLAVIPFMAIVGMLNPYGIDSLLYLYYSYGDQLKNIDITELASVNVLSIYGIRVLVGIPLLTAFVINREKKDSDLFYLTCGTFIMGVQCLRNLVYFSFGVYVLVVWLVKKINMDKVRDVLEKRKRGLLLYVMCAFSGVSLINSYQIVCELQKPFPDGEFTAVSALKYIEENRTGSREDCRIYTGFNSGAFFELNGYKCYVDARPELYFKKLNGKGEYFEEYMKSAVSTDPGFYEDFLKKYNFQYIVTGTKTGFALYLNGSDDYQRVIGRKDYYLFEKQSMDDRYDESL